MRRQPGARHAAPEPPSAFLVFGLSAVGRAGFDAVTDAADDAVGRCFVTFDIEILCSVQWRRRAAPPKPHIGQQAGGGRISERLSVRTSAIPLQSRTNASPFWIMLLLSSGTQERRMIERMRATRTNHVRKRRAIRSEAPLIPDYESGGQEFGSLRARHFYFTLLIM